MRVIDALDRYRDNSHGVLLETIGRATNCNTYVQVGADDESVFLIVNIDGAMMHYQYNLNHEKSRILLNKHNEEEERDIAIHVIDAYNAWCEKWWH